MNRTTASRRAMDGRWKRSLRALLAVALVGCGGDAGMGPSDSDPAITADPHGAQASGVSGTMANPASLAADANANAGAGRSGSPLPGGPMQPTLPAGGEPTANPPVNRPADGTEAADDSAPETDDGPNAAEGPAASGGSTADDDGPTPDIPDPAMGEAPLNGGDVRIFPAPGATELCPDPVLRMRFPSRPSLGNRGRVQIFAADQPDRPVAVLDLSAATAVVSAGGQEIRSRRAIVDGDQVLFYPPTDALEPGQTYFVTVDAGVVAEPRIAISPQDNWQFTLGDAKAGDMLRVSHDGSGDYCTVRGALATLAGSHPPVTLTIGRGTHLGPFVINDGQDITLRGDDRDETKLLGENNEQLNPGTATRGLFSVDRSRNITIENLTIHNLTPQGGGQAEALRMQRCEHCVARNLNVLSLQDTLLLSGSVYMEDSYIEGNVDYVWGTGAAFFSNCEFKTVGRGGYLVQSRNPADAAGYVFVNCRLTRGPSVDSLYLARIEVDRFPASEVVFIDCAMDSHVLREGFQTTGGLSSQLRFLEFGSTGLDGSPLDTSGRHRSSRRISEAEADRYRDPMSVLGFQP